MLKIVLLCDAVSYQEGVNFQILSKLIWSAYSSAVACWSTTGGGSSRWTGRELSTEEFTRAARRPSTASVDLIEVIWFTPWCNILRYPAPECTSAVVTTTGLNDWNKILQVIPRLWNSVKIISKCLCGRCCCWVLAWALSGQAPLSWCSSNSSAVMSAPQERQL